MAPRIVQVMGWRSQQYGSFERFLVALSRSGREMGVETHLVFQNRPPERFADDVEAAIHTVEAARGPLDARYVLELGRLLRRVGATHLNAHFGTDAYLALAVAQALGVQRRFMTKHSAPGRSRLTFADARHRWLGRHSERFFAVSHDVAERLATAGVPRSKIEVVYLGVSTRVYRPDAGDRERVRSELRLRADQRLILTASHLRPNKGVELMPEVFERVRNECPEAVLMLAGDGPARADIERAFARSASPPESYRFLGRRDDVPELLRAADLFVLPTAITEGMPLGTVEALASGCPVVATDVSDLTRLVSEVAEIVPRGDVAALAGGIVESLRRDGPEREQRSLAGRALVEERLSVDAAAQAYLESYLAPPPAG
ncbi:glycosyltransferase [Thermoleophilia bacterium SCSIO 60948]|nr:glycosyltransferase [Thermoleophilia bacterium SCSIO 60948]